MLKKSLLFCLFSGSALTGAMLCTPSFAMTSIPAPQGQQDKAMSEESASASASAQLQTQLDRSGVDRASVHLQILQQSNTHFSDSNSQKKPAPFDKKAQIKANSNS
jgi:hypothetical protein